MRFAIITNSSFTSVSVKMLHWWFLIRHFADKKITENINKIAPNVLFGENKRKVSLPFNWWDCHNRPAAVSNITKVYQQEAFHWTGVFPWLHCNFKLLRLSSTSQKINPSGGKKPTDRRMTKNITHDMKTYLLKFC